MGEADTRAKRRLRLEGRGLLVLRRRRRAAETRTTIGSGLSYVYSYIWARALRKVVSTPKSVTLGLLLQSTGRSVVFQEN